MAVIVGARPKEGKVRELNFQACASVFLIYKMME